MAKARGEIAIRMSVDEFNAFQTFRKVIDAQKQMEDGFKKVGRAGGRAGKKSKSAFGRAALSDLKNYAAGIIGLQSGINLVRGAFQAMNAERQKAAQQFRASASGFEKLAQLAGGDPKKLQDLIRRSQHFFRSGAAESQDAANLAIFALGSASLLKEQPLFERIGRIIPGVEEFIPASKTLQKAFGLSFKKNLSQILAASSFNPAEAAKLALGSSAGAATASQLGFSQQEFLSAVALVAESAGDPAVGGKQVAQLLNVIAKKPQIRGRTLAQSIENIQRLNLPLEQQIKFLGEIRAARAFGALTKVGPDVLRQKTAFVESESERRSIDAIISSAERTPKIAAARRARSSAAQEEIAASGLGLRRVLSEAAISRFRARGLESGAPELLIDALVFALKAKRSIFGDEQLLRGGDRFLFPQIPGTPIGGLDAIPAIGSREDFEIINKSDRGEFLEATRNLNDAADKINRGANADTGGVALDEDT